jgi:hypothetical protein
VAQIIKPNVAVAVWSALCQDAMLLEQASDRPSRLPTGARDLSDRVQDF